MDEGKKRRNFIIYAIIGISGATLDYLTFVAMMKWLPLHYLLINAISTSLGITNNFFLNAHFNFGVRDLMIRRFISFYSVGLIGMAVASGLLLVMVDLMGFIPEISKLVVIFVIVVLQYNLNKRISFRQPQS
jgi:putative flippase GtrA